MHCVENRFAEQQNLPVENFSDIHTIGSIAILCFPRGHDVLVRDCVHRIAYGPDSYS